MSVRSMIVRRAMRAVSERGWRCRGDGSIGMAVARGGHLQESACASDSHRVLVSHAGLANDEAFAMEQLKTRDADSYDVRGEMRDDEEAIRLMDHPDSD